MKKKLIIPAIATILLITDQLIKLIVIEKVSKTTIIEDFFYLVNVINTGGAWSIFSGQLSMLIAITTLVIAGLVWIITKEKNIKNLDIAIYGILAGGILGNLVDRIFRGYVVDYLEFKIFGYNFPVFNFADICIVSSVILIAILTIRGDKNEVPSN